MGVGNGQQDYESFVGKIPNGKVIMHQCDNPPCINPEHLKVGTNQENVLDAKRKIIKPPRKHFRESTTHSHAKLDWKKVNKIRKLYASGFYSYAELGRKFNITPPNTRSIVLNKTWRYKNKKDWITKIKNNE